MNVRLLPLVVGLVLLLGESLPAGPSYFPVAEIRAGMEGTGITVFEGTLREEFKVRVLGVLKNVLAPRRSLILARLEGGPLATTGVVAGMSGSPVYIEGRLVGAVSYALGSFPKEPIAGITPIEEMIEATTVVGQRARAERIWLELPVTRDALSAAMRRAFGRMAPFAERPGDVQAIGLAGADAARMGPLLHPIATPLVLSGFSGDALDLLDASLRGQGFVPVAGSGAGTSLPPPEGPLEPGDPVGISLLTGDLEFSAIGTVTHVDGDRVYAFGHPMYNLGPIEFPLTRAYVHTVLPSLMTSTKIASVGDVIGTARQDRATAVAGTLGKSPDLIPVTLSLESGRGLSKRFSFRLVNDQLFTPLLTYVAILNTLSSWERDAGAGTFTVKGSARVKDHGSLAFEDVFAGDTPSVGAATSVVAPLTVLLRNDFAPVEIEGVDLTISSVEEPRTATIERIWLDEARPRAGERVHLNILARTYRGDELTERLAIDLPVRMPDNVTVMVSDGSRLAQFEQRDANRLLRPDNIPQMLKALNDVRRNNRLYIRLLGSESGAIVNGESLPSLPPSVLAVFEADRNGGAFTPLRNASLGEWEMATDFALSGSRTLTISLGSN